VIPPRYSINYVEENLRCKAHLRYVDDMAVVEDDKARLHDIRAAVRERLIPDRLHLHPHKAQVSRVTDGLNLLGYVVFPRYWRLRNDNDHRFAIYLRRLAHLYRQGRLS
jgi:RNA-directed DNA polymerase